ncbi:MAG: molybdenum cofactor biosynthesis protein MoaE [Thermoplasmata archaeon]|nr:molybdenum cofactor biosynthesis protein MoaE [Thermoplasmata archaeon]MCI4337938.1 molybdenum cofactor biosynthesis protein MoaE [Thermoplasmata archaeon]MCI4341759.1 molybdenum cofactor biosynthesis protein MoaE [Thermoplasmata archaeon]
MKARIVEEPLSIEEAYRALDDRRSGGVALFVGRVRPDPTDAGPTRALWYEAHRRLAEVELDRLAARARRRFRTRRLLVWHRVGRVSVGEASVIVGAAAAHRAPALAAVRWLITELKRSAPIWKQAPPRARRAVPRRVTGEGSSPRAPHPRRGSAARRRP